VTQSSTHLAIAAHEGTAMAGVHLQLAECAHLGPAARWRTQQHSKHTTHLSSGSLPRHWQELSANCPLHKGHTEGSTNVLDNHCDS